jgi:hypothetical protein
MPATPPPKQKIIASITRKANFDIGYESLPANFPGETLRATHYAGVFCFVGARAKCPHNHHPTRKPDELGRS